LAHSFGNIGAAISGVALAVAVLSALARVKESGLEKVKDRSHYICK